MYKGASHFKPYEPYEEEDRLEVVCAPGWGISEMVVREGYDAEDSLSYVPEGDSNFFSGQSEYAKGYGIPKPHCQRCQPGSFSRGVRPCQLQCPSAVALSCLMTHMV